MINYFGPSSCTRPCVLPAYEKTGRFVIEPKFDGMFCMIEVDSFGSFNFFTRGHRRISDTFTSSLRDLKISELKDSMFLCELEALRPWSKKRVAERSYTIADVYDVFMLHNRDVRKESFEKRRTILAETMSIDSRFLKVVEQSDKNFLSFYERFRNLGYEGCVLKEKNANGFSHNKDGKVKTQIKVKEFGE